INVVSIMAPEHGFRGDAAPGETVNDSKDERTGLPIVSLYGKNKKPSEEQMGNVDVVVFFIQDVGARFYTYISTMHYVMEACAEAGKNFVVFDRPNPCDYIDGPIRDERHKSFVGVDPIPLLHGCTVGELAQMINGEGWLTGGKPCKLTVVKLDDWKHHQPFHIEVRPSPNLPNDHAITLYPSLCPFEGTPVSVGRGTPTPFELLQYPEIGYLREDFDEPTGFTLKYVIEVYRAFEKAGIKDKFFNRNLFFDLLMGTSAVRQHIIDGWSEEKIREEWQDDLDRYKQMRKKYVLYRDYDNQEP
ncbi:MAG: DUF1343 domain-containing protein, partial [Bacteroidia bacterium]|nr:DUF1343 domain-containing protein [Bacteroidia bacterium]